MNKSRVLRQAIGVVISVALIIVVFYKVNFAQFLASLRYANIYDLILCVFFFGLNCLIRALMWRITTRPLGEARINTLFGGVVVGYLVNNFLPLRAGEFFRAFYLAARTGFSGTAVFSTVCIERALDVFSMGLLLAGALIFGVHELTGRAADITLIVIGSIFLLAFIAIINIGRFSRIKALKSLIPLRLLHAVKLFITPLVQLGNFQTVLLLILFSLIAWASNYLSFYALLHSFVAQGFKAAILLLLFTNLANLIPSSPGALGVMQVAFWMALIKFGVAKEQALALSFIYQIGIYLFTIVVGLPYLVRTDYGSILQDIGAIPYHNNKM